MDVIPFVHPEKDNLRFRVIVEENKKAPENNNKKKTTNRNTKKNKIKCEWCLQREKQQVRDSFWYLN